MRPQGHRFSSHLCLLQGIFNIFQFFYESECFNILILGYVRSSNPPCQRTDPNRDSTVPAFFICAEHGVECIPPNCYFNRKMMMKHWIHLDSLFSDKTVVFSLNSGPQYSPIDSRNSSGVFSNIANGSFPQNFWGSRWMNSMAEPLPHNWPQLMVVGMLRP